MEDEKPSPPAPGDSKIVTSKEVASSITQVETTAASINQQQDNTSQRVNQISGPVIRHALFGTASEDNQDAASHPVAGLEQGCVASSDTVRTLEAPQPLIEPQAPSVPLSETIQATMPPKHNLFGPPTLPTTTGDSTIQQKSASSETSAAALQQDVAVDSHLSRKRAAPTHALFSLSTKVNDPREPSPTVTGLPSNPPTANQTTPTPPTTQSTTKQKPAVEHDSEWMKKRHLRLQHLFRRAKGRPSFVDLLLADYDADNDKDELPHAQEMELEHLPKRIRIDVDAELGLKDAPPARFVRVNNDQYVQILPNEKGQMGRQHETVDKNIRSPATASSNVISPSDEGWYEGTASVFLPEDVEYLNPLMVWIRQNVEYCSATQSTRKSWVSLGRVGISCLHCNNFISFPKSGSGIHTVCSVKFLTHFSEQCVGLPHDLKMQLAQLIQEFGDTPAEKKNVTAVQYSEICSKRIGLVTFKDGLRFSRDLSLEPLPFETVRSQLRNETNATVETVQRATADPSSEAVLAEAVSESEEGSLSKSNDKKWVSDYTFLLLRQIKVTHATQLDQEWGKIAKQSQIGNAGFCCRWCPTMTFGSRFFVPTEHQLSQVVNNAFAKHLRECRHIPARILDALEAYKSIHQVQRGSLPAGVTMRFFREFYGRLRSRDKPAAARNETSDAHALSRHSPANAPPLSPRAKMSPDQMETSIDRPASFPICEDPETASVLHAAVTSWDPASNDYLILPDDRPLISDYLFLAMRQLKVAFPDEMDAQRIRKAGGPPGFCCVHCEIERSSVSPSGRSFPSAPDNIASALLSSLYNHWQACPFVSSAVKSALVTTRKLHSAQCSKLVFGAQRRFFNQLFDRLTRAKGNEDKNAAERKETESIQLKKHRFMKVPASEDANTLYVCTRCRLIPFQFRARHSVLVGKPAYSLMQKHSSQCGENGLVLDVAVEALDQMIRKELDDDVTVIDRPAFKTIVKEAMGRNADLTRIFTEGIRDVLVNHRNTKEASSPATISLTGLPSDPLRVLCSLQGAHFTDVQEAFQVFAADMKDFSSDLQDHAAFLDYLMLVAPSLSVPSTAEPA